MDMKKKQKTRLLTPAFIIALISGFSLFLGQQLLTSGLPNFLTELTGNAGQAGLMTTAFMLGAMLIRPLLGYALHKLNVKILNIVFSLAFVIFIIGLAFTKSFPLMLLLRFLQGMCFGVLSTTINTMATSMIPSARIGEGVGYYGMASSGGAGIAPSLGALLVSISYTALIVVAGLSLFITFVLSLIYKPAVEAEVEDPDNEDDQVQEISLKEFAFDKRALISSLMVTCFGFILGGTNSFLTPYSKSIGLAEGGALFFIVQTIFLLFSKGISGNIYDRRGSKVIIYPSAILALLAMFMLARAQAVWTFVVAAAIFGFAYGSITAVLQTLNIEALPRSKQVTANSMFYNFMDLGMAVGSPILGAISGSFGYQAMFLACSVSILLIVIIYSLSYGRR